MTRNMDILFNAPREVVFCKKCVMSNQRPASIPEFKHKPNREGAKYLKINSMVYVMRANMPIKKMK